MPHLQFENLQYGLEHYTDFTSRTLIPAVARFAARLSDQQWKSLNYQILLRSRDKVAQVREVR